MQLKEIYTTRLEALAPDSTVVEAASKMLDNDIGALPVVDGAELAGIVTDRDIAVRTIARRLDPETTPVSRIMTEEVLSCSAEDDVADALQTMQRKRVRRLVVADGSSHPVGIVSLGDLALHADEERAGKTLKRVSTRR